MADDADEPLPRLALLFAQRLAQVGEHQQLVRPAALAELAAPDLPAPDAAGECGVDRRAARRRSRQSARSSSLGAASEQPLGRLAEQPRAGAVDELAARASSSKVNTATSISAITLRSSVVASSASRRWCRSVSTSAFTSIITSPSGSPPRAPRARIEKSPSPSAASRFDSVCSGSTTRSRSANAKPRQNVTMRTVSVHWTFGVKSPVQRKISEIAAPGSADGERHQQDAPVVAQARLARRGCEARTRGHGTSQLPFGVVRPLSVALQRCRVYSP